MSIRGSKPIKILVLAATPPPHHGQAYMVQLLLKELGDQRSALSSQPAELSIRHIDSKISHTLGELGAWRLAKFFRLLRIFLRTLSLVLTWRPDVLYYVPANGLRSQVWRDWILCGIPRRLIKDTLLHWHGLGLKPLYEESLKSWEKRLTRWALGHVRCSIILTGYQRQHVDWLHPGRIAVIPNGIPDPCPDFEQTILPARQNRLERRLRILNQPATRNPQQEQISENKVFRCLFLAHCTREKGLFEALDAIALVNQQLAHQQSTIRASLAVAGEFPNPEERAQFESRISRPDLNLPTFPPSHLPTRNTIHYLGYVSGEEKARLWAESDCLIFPSYYPTEVQPLTVIEAIACGMPFIISNWQGLPEICPPDYPFLIEPGDPGSLARAILAAIPFSGFSGLRAFYLEHYTLSAFREKIESSLMQTRQTTPPSA